MPARETVRHAIRELLALLSDARRQREYERSVPAAHAPGELLCMWFDDAYHPDDPAFRAAFSEDELLALARFHEQYEAVADEVLPLPGTVAELQARPTWARALVAADAALRSLAPSGA